MPLRPETVDRVNAMWHRPVHRPTVSVVTIGSDTFIAAPAFLQERVATLDPVLDAVLHEFGDEIEKIIGSVRLAYADDTISDLAPTDVVVQIADDDPRQRLIEARADRDEWLEGAVSDTSDARYAILEGGDVVAIATLGIWDDTVGSIGVFTDARVRGRGLAGCVASTAAIETVRRGFVAQWQSRVENDASARVADKLGFVTLGGRVVVRVRPRPDGSRTMDG
jgi:RimJ/RimL family protein N-acetyltransferase